MVADKINKIFEVRGTTWQRLTDCYVVARQYERTAVTFVDDLIINFMSEKDDE